MELTLEHRRRAWTSQRSLRKRFRSASELGRLCPRDDAASDQIQLDCYALVAMCHCGYGALVQGALPMFNPSCAVPSAAESDRAVIIHSEAISGVDEED